MMATSTELDFQQALKDLQEVNDQLFYDELKGKMAKHLQQVEAEFARVEESMDGVKFKLERFEDEFHRITQEASSQVRTAVANIEQEVPGLFEGQLSVLGDVFVSFSDLADEQKQIIQDSERVWRELSTAVMDNQKENNLAILREMKAHSLQQQESLKVFFEGVSREHEEQKGQVADLMTRLTEELERQRQEVSTGFSDAGALIEDSGEVVQMQLKKELAERDSVWQQQKEELELVKKQQEEDQAVNKKWLIGLVVAQVVLLAAVGGLYLM